jgi:hypothetical protein
MFNNVWVIILSSTKNVYCFLFDIRYNLRVRFRDYILFEKPFPVLYFFFFKWHMQVKPSTNLPAPIHKRGKIIFPSFLYRFLSLSLSHSPVRDLNIKKCRLNDRYYCFSNNVNI